MISISCVVVLSVWCGAVLCAARVPFTLLLPLPLQPLLLLHCRPRRRRQPPGCWRARCLLGASGGYGCGGFWGVLACAFALGFRCRMCGPCVLAMWG